jgi:hypothetical protein
LFEPRELIEKLAALIAKPGINLLLYHGVFGPSARLRSRAVAAARSLQPSARKHVASMANTRISSRTRFSVWAHATIANPYRLTTVVLA